MGHPKKQKKKYSKPRHPWEKERIEEERALLKEYGFKNKKEIWKLKTLLKKFSDQAKRLTALKTEQAKKEKKEIEEKLKKIGILEPDSQLSDILRKSIKDFAERRLQTIVYKKGLAKSVKQARQFIIHRHIIVNGKKISSPSYLVSVEEENKISFYSNSPLAKKTNNKIEKDKENKDGKQKGE